MTTDSTGAGGDDLLALDRQLCFAVYAAANAFNRFYKPLLEPLGLTYPQYLAMLVLWEEDGLTVSGLGHRLGLDSGTLTPLLKRMEAAGLVDRTRSASDERQVLITLTDAGRRLRAEAEGIPTRVICATGRPDDSLARIREELEALRRRLGAAERPASEAAPEQAVPAEPGGPSVTSSAIPRRSHRR